MKSNTKETKIKKVSNKFKKLFNQTLIPSDIKISTATITCALSTTFNLEHISKYIDLDKNGILKIKCGDVYVRELESLTNAIQSKKKRKKRKSSAVVGKKKKTKSSHFYNQATLVVSSSPTSTINIKIFANGSFQLTGCKGVEHCINSMYILFEKLKIKKAVIDNYNKNKIIIKPFVDNIDDIDIEKLHSFNVSMINSNFWVGFKINRSNLFDVLINDGIECTYEPLVHASVDIKYKYKKYNTENTENTEKTEKQQYKNKSNISNINKTDKTEKKVSIFVFEKGSIIITGANSCEQIADSYNFIFKKLCENYRKIYKLDVMQVLEEFTLNDNNNTMS